MTDEFQAEAIDLHMAEDGQSAVLTIVSQSQGLTVRLPRAALEAFLSRASRRIGASPPQA